MLHQFHTHVALWPQQAGWFAHELRMHVPKPHGCTKQTCRITATTFCNASPEKVFINTDVRTYALREHLLKHFHCTLQVPAHHTTLHQIAVDMHVQPKVVLRGDLITQLEGPVEAFASASELHEHREREVGGRHASLLHLLQQRHAFVVETLTSASVKQRVVHDLVWAEPCSLQHLLQHLESFVKTICLAIALYNRTICDNIGLNALCHHAL
mmetsp:Transcript_56624/g.103625  ORF Transcript_56624/g.103625 Transcript_56624/m.103625 type:complete len:212 (+) Transcript_56624:225-860(+)